jgi:hypothetical protein
MSVPFRAYRLHFDARAVDVSLDETMLHVTLADGRTVSTPLTWFPRLHQATVAQRAAWRFIGPGVGISWEEIDEDLEVAAILRTF